MRLLSVESGARVFLDSPCVVDLNASTGNSTYHESGESELGSLGVIIGVIMGLVSSIFINIGQNIQSIGATARPEYQDNPCSSKTWRIGLYIFLFGSIGNQVSFSFAPASVLVPLEAVQFVTNVIFSKFVNKVSAHRTRPVAVTTRHTARLAPSRWARPTLGSLPLLTLSRHHPAGRKRSRTA